MAVTIAALLLGAVSAKAADYRTYGLSTQPKVADASGATAYLRAHFILPAAWKRLSSPKGTLRFREGHGSCFYTVSLSVRAHVAATAPFSDHLAADLPVPTANYVIDSGVRAPGQWRVTRLKSTGGVVHVRGEYVRSVHTDAGLLAAGQTAFGEIVAAGDSRPGDECHSGTWRNTLGPALGDAFATTRMTAYLRKA